MTVPAMLRRPAPLVLGAPPEQSEHGAPVVRRGELAAATRDASYLSSPNTRADVQLHAAVVTRRYAVGSGLTGIGAACDPVRILLDEGLIFGARELPKSHCRRPACRALFEAADRQHGDLERMRAYYGLQERHGVDLGLAIRVRHGGRAGTVVDTAGRDLLVRLDGVPQPVRCHVTRAMEYETGAGQWTAVTTVDRGAAPAAAG
ncbi:hypothetical protein E5083_30460 [Streptomyces bauhiniae]|uniref:Uncharacterized protein n=1 Tax=Streptomyces bauhiniae TaxID=2340725 RepID=A0A4Z1CTR8_9ACTN|nr:hypothetical protein [Streptomyces bauhiniae]TGN72258.1 hypothetical protein E5083_30460 [Streptomyces bauhiniae]